MKKKFWIGVLVVSIAIGGVLKTTEESEVAAAPETTKAVVETTEVPVVTDGLSFLDGLGYTEDEVAGMREILTNVGISEIMEPEIGNEVNGIRVIKGLAYEDYWMGYYVRVQVNIENGKIFLVGIHCPERLYEDSPEYLDGLEDRRADLYYDVEGGYLKKIDWENRVVVGYED